MWHLVAWFSGRLGSAGQMVGLDLKGLFQSKQFHDSVTSVTFSTSWTQTYNGKLFEASTIVYCGLMISNLIP